jgi:predicted alpha-1,2-mannosidase
MLIDAHLRGVGGFDVERTYAHLAAAAMAPIDANGVARAGRECIDRYVAIGFCPADGGGDSTSETLENAYNDWMLANLAEDLGHADDAERFRARSRSWTHHFNPETGYLQAKLADGTFAPDFDDELFSEDFVEGNARQWSVYVPYDVAHLAERMGGTEVLAARLDAFFENTRSAEKTIFPDLWYWHGNEVDIHAPYMFGELGRRDLIEKWVSWIMDARYGNGPDGLDGNDDGGTLSAWYVFSALGFFPLAGSDRYIIGVPRFDRVELELEDHTLVIRRREDGEVALDGVRVEGPHLRHDDLVRARELDL